MDNRKRIRRYIRKKFSKAAKIYPKIKINEDEYYCKYLNSEEDFEKIKNEIDLQSDMIIKNYQELLKQQEYFRQLSEEKESLYYMKMPVENKTFYELQKTLIKFQNILGNNFEKLYLTGGIVPYLLLDTDSGRLHEDIDTICFEEDINHLREIFKLTPYYSEKWDSIYYDTEEKDLLKKMYAFRVRYEDARPVATMKWGGGAEEGLHQRGELNVTVNEVFAECPNVDIFKGSEIYEEIAEAVGEKPLIPVMEMEFVRKQMHVDTGKSISVVSFDEGEIRTAGGTAPISEVEVELYSGDQDDMIALGKELANII